MHLASTEQTHKATSLVMDAIDVLDDLGGSPDDLREIADWLEDRWPMYPITPLATSLRALLFKYDANPQALRELAAWGDVNLEPTHTVTIH